MLPGGSGYLQFLSPAKRLYLNQSLLETVSNSIGTIQFVIMWMTQEEFMKDVLLLKKKKRYLFHYGQHLIEKQA